MIAGLIDTHCHLNEAPLSDAIEAILERARDGGLERCVSVSTTLEASRANVALARRHPLVRAAVGIHPHEADGVTDRLLTDVESLAGEPGVVAIGEVGLDHYRQHASPERQRGVLEAFVAMAQRRGLPLVLHCRDAYQPLLELLGRCARRPVRGVIHCASGPPEFIREALAMGLHVSFAGTVTFPKAQAIRELVPLVPDDRMLVETDAPFLAPQPVRGQRNEPAFITHTAACLAQVRGQPVEVIARLTGRNARQLFSLPEASGPEQPPRES